MKNILLFIGLAMMIGCVSAKLAATGVNVQDSLHAVNVQANSINAEVNTYVK